jgi:hypothetical protein
MSILSSCSLQIDIHLSTSYYLTLQHYNQTLNIRTSVTMASCTHEKIYLKPPPPAEFITQNYPYIHPNLKLNRTIPRCKLCDLIKAQDRAIIAENPPPGINIVERIKHDIDLIEEMIAAGISTKQDEEDLVDMKVELDNAIALANVRIHEAWLPYWDIWGPGDGPSLLIDSLFDDGEDLIDWGV